MKSPSILAPSTTRAIEDAATAWVVKRDAGFSAAEAAEFAAWSDADSRHAAAFARLSETWRHLDRPRQAGHAAVLLEKFAASTARRRRHRFVATGGALALLVLAGALWRQSPSGAETPLAAAVAATPARVMRPETRPLSDGSVIELRPGAKVAVDFDAALRRVALLVGEAHFQVAKDHARPFVVTAGASEVRAVGTGFSVELAADGIDIVVTEGRVGVAPIPVADRSTADVRPEIFLVAHERTLVPYATTPAEPPPVQTLAAAELADRLAWRGVRLEFTDTPLREAVDLMNRHASGEHRVRLVVNDPELARTPITGLFRADNTETFVGLLATSFGGRAERTGDTIVLHPAR